MAYCKISTALINRTLMYEIAGPRMVADKGLKWLKLVVLAWIQRRPPRTPAVQSQCASQVQAITDNKH